ncbi:hypothetical protein BGX38DRAFT_1129393 [Terfezia claveryi]|nr:hypothetical protein BGX38DRAFT_1129393 [Terfezia claveryi]
MGALINYGTRRAGLLVVFYFIFLTGPFFRCFCYRCQYICVATINTYTITNYPYISTIFTLAGTVSNGYSRTILSSTQMAPTTAPPQFDQYEPWIRENLLTLGFSQTGLFIGLKKFKTRLIETRDPEIYNVTLIRRAVNWMSAQGILDTSSRPIHIGLAPESSIRNSDETSSTVEVEYDDIPWVRPALPEAVPTVVGPEALPIVPGPEAVQVAVGPELVPVVAGPKVVPVIPGPEAVPVVVGPEAFPGPEAVAAITELPSLPNITGASELALSLLRLDDPDDLSDSEEKSIPRELSANDVETALLFSSQLLHSGNNRDYSQRPLQYGLLGRLRQRRGDQEQQYLDARVFLNTNIPGSFFICGLQGSGKSHTLATLLENYLIPSPQIGVLDRPHSVLVLHFGESTSGWAFRPCEAAYLAQPSMRAIFSPESQLPKVKVFVPPSSYYNLAAAYKEVPNVTVHPLKFPSRLLTINSIITLMTVSRSGSSALYMSQVIKELRDMAEFEGVEGFDYQEFKRRMEDLKKLLDVGQSSILSQGLRMLDTFVEVDTESSEFAFEGAEAGLTVIDLSCPFVSVGLACRLFDVAISQFLSQSSPEVAKVIAVDEAHKYLGTTSAASSAFSDTLLTIIRQQRHMDVRVIIATQEPTLPPRLMDLVSVTIIHRFVSPDWLKALQKHLCIGGDESKESKQIFKKIQRLRTGEALVFAPTAILIASARERWMTCGSLPRSGSGLLGNWIRDKYDNGAVDETSESRDEVSLRRMDGEMFQIKIRERITHDGGATIAVSG